MSDSYYNSIRKNLDPLFKEALGTRGVTEQTQMSASRKRIATEEEQPTRESEKRQRITYYQTNFQGFPIEECAYCEELDDWVFCPPYYDSDPECALCKDCFLRPCVKLGKMDEFMVLSAERSHDYNGDSDTIKYKILEGVEDIAKEVFGDEHVLDYGIPSCLIDLFFTHLEDVAFLESFLESST